jgi:arylsulfatase A-like enzyme
MTLAAHAARPNIVVLVADDWGFTDVGSLSGARSPRRTWMRWLAPACRFSNFHVAASCSHRRAAMLLTGVGNHRNGVGNLRETMPQASIWDVPGTRARWCRRSSPWPALLQAGGYRTIHHRQMECRQRALQPAGPPRVRPVDHPGRYRLRQLGPEQRYLPHTAQRAAGSRTASQRSPAQGVLFLDLSSWTSMIDYLRSGQSAAASHSSPTSASRPTMCRLQAPREFIDKYRGRYKDGWTALARGSGDDRAAALGLIPKDVPLATMPTNA